MMTEERSGVLLIDKPRGVTSHDVVGTVRRLYHTRRVGHTGTLDPMATGVLVVLIGRAAKAAEYLTGHGKVYRAELQLGLTTDTQDITGTTLTTCADIPTSERVVQAADSFVGDILQTPPMYSALKVKGQKLVDLARRGIEVERTPRPITVHSITCEPLPNGNYTLTVSCSAGTYIRTLCADIGEMLGCGGVMAALRRTEAGGFTLSQCTTLAALEQMDEQARGAQLIPTESLFGDLPAICLPSFYERLCRSGCEIYQKKIDTQYGVGTRVRLCDENGGFFALGEIREYENGTAVKSVKLFDI